MVTQKAKKTPSGTPPYGKRKLTAKTPDTGKRGKVASRTQLVEERKRIPVTPTEDDLLSVQLPRYLEHNVYRGVVHEVTKALPTATNAGEGYTLLSMRGACLHMIWEVRVCMLAHFVS